MKNLILILATCSCWETSYSQIITTSTLADVKYHLTARPWHPLNISRDIYLSSVEGIVRTIAKFQNSSGAIIDPYAHREVQYSTPYFANAVGTLISAGRATDLLGKGIAAMNSATADIAAGLLSIPDNHGEFFLAPLASAIPLYTAYVSASQLQTWKTRMAKPIKAVILGYPHNWRTYAMKGEWNRAVNGYVNKDTAISWIEDSWTNTQKARFSSDARNFYHDNSTDPDTWAYEAVARGNLLAMIARGYAGRSRNEILTLLKKGTQASLLLQDPTGQVAAGGRSGNHTWNDILLANGYETMAEIVYEEGDLRLAGQYRHAAALAFQSAQRWRRSDGTYSVTKNHFDPAAKVGYASYSYFANYNGNMLYHMSENYLRHKSVIAEQPTPNEIGGYTIVTDNKFATAIANAGGMLMEVCLRGATKISFNKYWTALGITRFSRPGWDSRLGPSDGVRDTLSKLGASFAPTFFENGQWIRLASVPERYEAVFTTQFAHPLLVRCRVLYRPRSGKTGATFTNDFVITPDGILSTLTSTSTNFGITWPILTFDGLSKLDVSVTSAIASVSFSGQGDQQNFIALHSSPIITSAEAANRTSYGDVRPIRMVSGSANNVTMIYPRSYSDPSGEAVRKSFVRTGTDFSTILGRIKGNTYVGRTAAGGVAASIDVDNDGQADATFNMSTGFILQLQSGLIKRIETDRDVTAIIYGKTLYLKAFEPKNVSDPYTVAISKVIASSDDGNVAENTLDGDDNTRWSAYGDNQWITYYLGEATLIKAVQIAWFRGSERKASFDIQTSSDGVHWTTVFSGQSSGGTTAFETYDISPVSALYIRIIGHGNTSNSWNAITEVRLLKDDIYVKNKSKVASEVRNNYLKGHSQADSSFYDIKIWPNPTNGLINIRCSSYWQNCAVSGYDISGKIIFKNILNKASQQINLPKLPKGNYVISFRKDEKVLNRKIAVE